MEPLTQFIGVPENANLLMVILFFIKRIVASIGVIVILTGACMAIYQFFHTCHRKNHETISPLDLIRLRFGKIIVLGLEFIVAADVIETTTAPDYYSVGILASLVGIRTLLTYFMNRELKALSPEK